MTNEPLTWGALFLALVGNVALVKFWMDMGANRKTAENAERSVHEAHERIDELSKTTAKTVDIAAAERRFAEAVDGLRGDFRHMANRLDTLLLNIANKA